jgi:TolB-like protein
MFNLRWLHRSMGVREIVWSHLAILLVIFGAVLAGSSTASADEPLVVAIADFTEPTDQPELRGFSRSLVGILTTDLASNDALKLVERSQLQALQSELEFSQSDWVDTTSAAELGRLLGAQYLVVGEVTLVGEDLRLDFRLVEVETGTVSLAEKVVGSMSDALKLEAQLVAQVFESLDIQPSHQQQFQLEQRAPVSVGVLTSYAEALALLDEGENSKARERLNKIVA